MRLLKEALGLLGALVVLAVIVAFVAPKRARAVAAALVQIVPGTTTHIGQNESQLVSLTCPSGNCNAVDPEGNVSTSAYVVPTGKTLIVTDYQFFFSNELAPNTQNFDQLTDSSSGAILAFGSAISDKDGNFYDHEHYATGIRIGSGVTIADGLSASSLGAVFVQGYLVPND